MNRKKKAKSKAPAKTQGNNPKNQNNGQKIVHRSQEWSGPIPPPAILEQYDFFLPGAADRIITMAEKETVHRREMEVQAQTASIDLQNRNFDERRLGQIFGFGISLAVIVGGVILGINGVEGWGTLLSLSGVAALAGVFVFSHKGSSAKN